jgi:23S rRNA pseudouridine2605 synthase
LKSEQINAARLVRWSQNGEARLTLESAAEWLQEIGCCAFLPPAAGAPPHASLLEAVVGRPAPAPSAGELSRGRDLLARLLESNAALPLRLGTASADADLIISPDILRYFLALHPRGNARSAPSVTGNERVSTLALHCWELLNERGAMTLSEMQTALGSEMTEAAILRALEELWTHLYAFPLLVGSSSSTPARWDLIARRFPQQVAAGASTGQAEAYSALISLYIAAVIAAEEEQVLAFLAPVAPQSKLREVMRTLGALRQLDMVDVQGKACLTLAGQGVAMGEWPEAPATVELAAEEQRERPQRPASAWRSKTDTPRRTFDRRPREDRAGSRDSQGRRDRPGFGDRAPSGDRERTGAGDQGGFSGPRKLFRSGPPRRDAAGDRGGFAAPRKPFRNGPPRREGDGERRPSFGARPAQPWGGPPRNASRSDAGLRKFPRKPAGDRPAPPADGFKSFRRAEDGESPRPFRPRPKFGEDRGPQDRRRDRRPSFHPRGEGASSGPRGSSAGSPFKRRRPEAGAGDGERSPKRWSKPSGPRGVDKRPRTGAPPKRRTVEGRPPESRGGDSPTGGREREGAPSKKPFWAKKGLISKSSGRSRSGKKSTGKSRGGPHGGKDKGR